MRVWIAVAVLMLTWAQATAAIGADTPWTVIDVHGHAGPSSWRGTGTPEQAENAAHLKDVLAEMDANAVRLMVISGPMAFVEHWKKVAPQRFIASAMLPCENGRAPLGGRECFSSGQSLPDLAWLRAQYAAGQLGALGEITTQYAGMSPADPALDPYYALAAEFGVPAGVHTGLSYPGTPYNCCPNFRANLGRPLLLEEVLIRHPKLPIYAMHGGVPYVEEMIAMLSLYPQLHVDISAINFVQPMPVFHAYLRRLIELGFEKRILFGSDGFPMAAAIASIRDAEFLSESQKRDILCGNAARLFRLDADLLCAR